MGAIDLDDVHGIEEREEHFIVDHAKRGKFRIAKSAISGDVADTIRSVAKGKAAAADAIRNMPDAEGVTHAAEGADVPAADDASAQRDPADGYSPMGPLDALKAGWRAFVGPPLNLKGDPTPATGDLKAYLPLTAGAVPAGPQVPALPSAMPVAAIDNSLLRHAPPVPTKVDMNESTDRVAASDPFAAQGVREGDDWLTRYKALVGGSAQPATTDTAAPAPQEPTPQIAPFDETALNSARDAHARAIDEHGRIVSALASEQKQIQDFANADLHGMAQEYNAKIERNNSRLQSVADDLARNPVRRKDIGWAGTLGIALGAFGAALSKSPNFALEIVNKKIDDDLAAQRDARADKQNTLKFYQAQGMSLENAYKMARADKLAEADGDLRAAAYASGSKDAIALADAAHAKLMGDAVLLSAQAHHADFLAKSAPIAFAAELKTKGLQDQMLVAQQKLVALQAVQAPMKAQQEAALNVLKMKREIAETQKATADADKAKSEGVVRFPKVYEGDGGDVVIGNYETRKLLNKGDTKTVEAIQRDTSALGAIQRMNEFFRPGFRAGPESNKEFAVLKQELRSYIRQPGESSDADATRLDEALANATTWSQLTGADLTALRSLSDRFRRHLSVIEKSSLE
jgi:hypothetical protein